jgi:hypothetical protein
VVELLLEQAAFGELANELMKLPGKLSALMHAHALPYLRWRCAA